MQNFPTSVRARPPELDTPLTLPLVTFFSSEPEHRPKNLSQNQGRQSQRDNSQSVSHGKPLWSPAGSFLRGFSWYLYS